MDAVEELGKPYIVDVGRRLFHNPSLVLKLEHSLIKLAWRKFGMGVRRHDKNLRKDAKAFLKLKK